MTRILGVLICLFIAATAYMSTTVSQRQKVLRHVAHHNDTWAISQSVSEFMRLEARLALSEHPMDDETYENVRLRLDIIISRLTSFKEGTLKTFIEESPSRKAAITELLAVIGELDKNLATMDAAHVRAILQRMGDLNGPLTTISSQSVQQSWADIEENLQALEQLHRIYSIVVAFLILCWVVLIFLLFRQNRLLMQAQKEAETLNNSLSVAGKELRDKNRRLEYVAHHDSLTKLPNRILFWNELETSLKASQEVGTSVCLLLLDLDDFKNINDTMGHDLGDMLLDQASARMLKFGSEAHMFCRLGGDEFACLLLGKSPSESQDFARELTAQIAAPYRLSNREVQIGCSVGIAHAEQPKCADAQMLFKRADIGLYRAKASAQERICLFEDYMQAEFDDRKALENDLHLALERDEFELYYQAQVEVVTLNLRGLEALVRWNHPTRGQIPPGVFIPIAEEIGLIVELGRKILLTACTEAAKWKQPLKIAVNLSPIQLQAPNIVEIVMGILKDTGLAPERLELEMTETVLLNDRKRVFKILNDLRALGVTIAMDDFGTGYSSLAILRDIPFDTIKLDKSFVRDIALNPEAEALVRLVIDVGNHLGKTVIIEGIETDAQHECIRRIGCQVSQGFLFARPVQASKLDFLHWSDAELAPDASTLKNWANS
ncbi:putative bifunctional diguanylate cyclase/phosphodiesterase [Paracoccus aestuariivivens]|uniref:EAL domain-containing protein n=1 Tax=Paracoccus aestuariivivens TaxID=1820333 RepID=A0A6L6JH44_9RHOB|nr:EAL domain-containing protein [Paracoccus aestuariivivens]MTH79201.1 EAL domain-containing protein [Paracoccus aestuariivivens]